MKHVEDVQPGILIIDSIQTVASGELESSAGSVSQIRECASQLLKLRQRIRCTGIIDWTYK